MDYIKKTDSNDNNQDSELSKINTNTTIRPLNNNIFINNSLLSDGVKINVLNGNDISIKTNLNNTLFYNHSNDNNKVNSTIRTQCFIFIPLVSIKILITFILYQKYLIYVNYDKNIYENTDIKHEKYFSYTLIIIIYLCYFLSIRTSSKQMKIEKYIYKKINNNINGKISNNNEDKNKNNIHNNDNNNLTDNNFDNLDKENVYNNQVINFNNKDEKLSEKITYFDLKNYNQVCNYCHIRTFIRATHCLICDECILFKEEHCPYIANCIGFNNIQYFINLIFWCIFGLIYYNILCIKYFIYLNVKISLFPLIILISDFAINIMILKTLVQKLYKLLYNIYNNITQYERQFEDDNNGQKKHNLFNLGFLTHFYYLIGPTPFHFIFPLPKIKTYGNDENCPIFLKCKFPNRLELVKFLSKKQPKYKDFLDNVECDPKNYIKLCHDFYDKKYID